MEKESMEKRIIRMALNTWDAIGGDILTVCEEMGKEPVMTKAEVIESVCDAGYMSMYGGDKEAYDFWKALPTWKAREAAVAPAFSYRTYGW